MTATAPSASPPGSVRMFGGTCDNAGRDRMHGSLFHGFKQFVLRQGGPEQWTAVVQAAKATDWYFATKSYPDEELESLVNAFAAATGTTAAVVWVAFGAAVVPSLVTLYGAYLQPDWHTLDLLENVERVIHRTVRMQDKAAAPPRLVPTRTSPGEVQIEYASDRRLCSFAEGICQGVAAHYGETVTIEHPQCMLTGAPRCLIVVRLA